MGQLLFEQCLNSRHVPPAFACRLLGRFKPRDERGELSGNRASILDGVMESSSVDGSSPAIAGNLALDEPAEPDADGSGPERGAVLRPGLVAYLDASHAIPWRPSAALSSLFPLPSSPSHDVYVVDDASDGATACGERSAATRSGGIALAQSVQ